MRKRFAGLLLALVAGALAPCPAFAARTRIWQQTNYPDFARAESINISVSSDGYITLGPWSTRLPIRQVFVWDVALDSKGQIYVATGQRGFVYKISADGKRVTEICQLKEMNALCVAVDQKSRVYVGTAPDGVVYRISPDGTTERFFDAEDPYIWDLAFDAEGNLLVATGNRGRLYRVNERGRAKLLCDTTQRHLTRLLVGDSGEIYATSAPNGFLYRITQDGKVSVLMQAEEGEIHCIAKDSKGNLYVGTAGGAQLTRRSAAAGASAPSSTLVFTGSPNLFVPAQAAAKPGASSTPSPSQDAKQTAAANFLGAPLKTNAVYVVEPDGAVRRVFTLPKTVVFSLAVDKKDNVYIGTGNEGKILRLHPDYQRFDVWVDLKEAVVLALAMRKDGVLIAGTCNLGRVYLLGPNPAPKGELLSGVLDAREVSKWGRIWWNGVAPEGTTVTLAVRSGNTSRPDESWSPWMGKVQSPEGDQIPCPPARRLQYRVSLRTTSPKVVPRVSEINAAFVPVNHAPEIGAITINGASQPSQANMKTFSLLTPNKRQKTIQWQAKDEDGDKLIFDLFYRSVGSNAWLKIAEDLKQTKFDWKTDRIPDGRYELKIVAKDELDNAAEDVLSVERISPEFYVDNTPPRVSALKVSVKGKKAEVRGEAQDATGNILEVEYAVDDKDWKRAAAVDGIFDSPKEEFLVQTDELDSGLHTIAVRAFDSEKNIGYAHGQITIK